MSVTGKAVTTAFYASKPRYPYSNGCSTVGTVTPSGTITATDAAMVARIWLGQPSRPASASMKLLGAGW